MKPLGELFSIWFQLDGSEAMHWFMLFFNDKLVHDEVFFVDNLLKCVQD